MDSTEDETPMVGTPSEMKELLGLYDVPAFARRGQDLEYALDRLNARFRRERAVMLEMVRVRLRQWATIASGPSSSLEVFMESIDNLWALAEAPPPVWAGSAGPSRKLRIVAKDLVASLERFNRRWTRLIEQTPFDPINTMIERYNRYYVLEKECSLGSARLANRYFVPRPKVSPTSVLESFPLLPVPDLRP